MLKMPEPASEQRAFEDWLESKRPSGDVEAVQYQWARSTEYAEFVDSLKYTEAQLKQFAKDALEEAYALLQEYDHHDSQMGRDLLALKDSI